MDAPPDPAHSASLRALESCAGEAESEPHLQARAGTSRSLAGSADEECRIAREALAHCRPVRAAKVNALRGALRGGAYTVDAAELAEKMLGSHSNPA